MKYMHKSFFFLFIGWIFALTGNELVIQMELKPNPVNAKANMNMILS